MKLKTMSALLIAGLVAACSSASTDDGGETPDTKPGADAAPELDTTPGPGADSTSPGCGSSASFLTSDGLCNNLPFPTTRAPFTAGIGNPPAFTGGTLVDGLYVAVKAEGWNVTAGSGRQMGIVIADGGKTMLWFGQTLNADGSGDVDAGTANLAWLRGNYALAAASANTLTVTKQCSVGTTSAPGSLLYTATTTEPPQLILANAGATDPTAAVTTYQRQGCP
jgi:hypothetical protein